MLTASEMTELQVLLGPEIKIIIGLSKCGHAVMSATDHYYQKRLEETGLVQVWMGIAGIHLWCLTQKGRDYAKS